jgi:hypothetical protein
MLAGAVDTLTTLLTLLVALLLMFLVALLVTLWAFVLLLTGLPGTTLGVGVGSPPWSSA